MRGLAVLLVAAAVASSGSVTVERRDGRDWLRLSSQASTELAVARDTVEAVITDYRFYPRLFPRIRQVAVQTVPGATLLSETVVISALGLENINRFTLRVTRTDLGAGGLRLAWTQEATDGSIDGLEGSWLLQDLGRPGAPRTRVEYQTRSSVPVRVFGQEAVVRLFLASETGAVVQAVAKEAQSR